jgi:hypothetical protein
VDTYGRCLSKTVTVSSEEIVTDPGSWKGLISDGTLSGSIRLDSRRDNINRQETKILKRLRYFLKKTQRFLDKFPDRNRTDPPKNLI